MQEVEEPLDMERNSMFINFSRFDCLDTLFTPCEVLLLQKPVKETQAAEKQTYALPSSITYPALQAIYVQRWHERPETSGLVCASPKLHPCPLNLASQRADVLIISSRDCERSQTEHNE